MGKEILQIAKERGHILVNIFDTNNLQELTIENLQKANVVFEFSTPQAAYNNVKLCLEASVPCVCGTTGWTDKLEEIKQIVISENKTLFYSTNYSIGMNILFAINKRLAQIINNFPEYTPSITEIHHIHKLDKPSGTAITLANQILENLHSKTKWELDSNDPLAINITAIREGENFGFHQVSYESDFDTIKISHQAKNRKGLALGAVLAAEFVYNKKGFYTMENLLNL